jgi:hypothetical protein
LPARDFKAYEYSGFIYVKWEESLFFGVSNATVYVLESRNQTGPVYNESLMGPWEPTDGIGRVEVSGYTRTSYRQVRVRAGRFYQFRLAIVNRFGTRGFQYSKVVMLKRGERKFSERIFEKI